MKQLKLNETVSVRIPFQYCDEIKASLSSEDFPYETISECLREGGIFLVRAIRYRNMLKDKGKAKEFTEQVNELIKTENVGEFTHNADEELLAIMASAIKTERKNRSKNPNQSFFV